MTHEPSAGFAANWSLRALSVVDQRFTALLVSESAGTVARRFGYTEVVTSEMERTRDLVVAAWVGSTNLGDELVFAALSEKLSARNVVATAVSVNASATRNDHAVEAIGTWDLTGLARSVRGAGGMVLGGGGLLQDVTSPFNLPLHLSRTWLARALDTPLAGVGLGAGPLGGRAGRSLVRRSLAGALAVSCRDGASADVVAATGLPRPEVSADLALSLPPPAVPGEDRVVASLRPWTGRRSFTPVALRRRADPAPAWFLDAAAAGLDEIGGRTGLAVHLVAFQGDRDHEVHQLVAGRMRRPVTTSRPTVHTVLAEVARSRVVVGMRYHAGIAAAVAGIPSVLVGYTPKVPSLAADLGRGSVGLRWEADELGRLATAVEEVLDRGDDVVEARESLLVREKVNDAVLDRLLDVGLRG